MNDENEMQISRYWVSILVGVCSAGIFGLLKGFDMTYTEVAFSRDIFSVIIVATIPVAAARLTESLKTQYLYSALVYGVIGSVVWLVYGKNNLVSGDIIDIVSSNAGVVLLQMVLNTISGMFVYLFGVIAAVLVVLTIPMYEDKLETKEMMKE